MTKTGKTILLVVVGLAGLVGITIVGVGVWFFTSVLQTVAADEARATQSFADVRARFAGAEPVLRMTERGPELNRQPPETAPERDVQRVSLIAWDPDDEQLATVTLPFWLLRLKKDGEINLSSSSTVPNVRVAFKVSEVERYGPALLMDFTSGDGSRVLIWTE